MAAAEHAFQALTWNYRITPELAAPLFSTQNLFLILAMFADFDQVRKAAQQLGKLPGAPTPTS